MQHASSSARSPPKPDKRDMRITNKNLPWVLQYYTSMLFCGLGSYSSYLYLKSIYFFSRVYSKGGSQTEETRETEARRSTTLHLQTVVPSSSYPLSRLCSQRESPVYFVKGSMRVGALGICKDHTDAPKGTRVRSTHHMEEKEVEMHNGLPYCP